MRRQARRGSANMLKMLGRILEALGILALFVLVGYGLSMAEGRRARVECEGWKVQAQELAGFYLTKGEAMQCDAVGVQVF